MMLGEIPKAWLQSNSAIEVGMDSWFKWKENPNLQEIRAWGSLVLMLVGKPPYAHLQGLAHIAFGH